MSLGADETIANSDTLRKPDVSSEAGAETSAAAAADVIERVMKAGS